MFPQWGARHLGWMLLITLALTACCTAMSWKLVDPLNDSSSHVPDCGYNSADGNKGTNYYFGMRYDVEFEIGRAHV